MNILNIHMDLPNAAYAIFVIIVYVALFWSLYQYRQQILNSYASADLLPNLLVARPNFIYWGKSIALCLIWFLATLALMQPKGNSNLIDKTSPPKTSTLNLSSEPQRTSIVKRKSQLVIFLLDASASMSVTDSRNGKSRLDYAKEIADEIIRKLKGETATLYAFTSELTQLSPPTPDYFFLRLLLRQIQINEGDASGTDIENALTELNKLYFTTSLPSQKTVVMFSDGGDNRLDDLQGKQREEAIAHLTSLITPNRASPLRILTVGMGSSKGGVIPGLLDAGQPVHSALEPDVLISLSQKGRGSYYEANALPSSELAEKIDTIIEHDSAPSYLPEENSAVEQGEMLPQGKELVYDLYYQFPLGLALFLMMLVLFLPDTWTWKGGAFKLSLLIFFMCSNLYCAEDNMFLVQQMLRANAFFETTSYRSSQEIYEELLHSSLTAEQKALINYNLGSVLLAEQQWEHALSTFSESLYQSTSPFLNSASLTGMAWAHFNLVGINDDSQAQSPYEDSYLKNLYLLENAQQEIILAKQIFCLVIEGGNDLHCTSESFLGQLDTAIKWKTALLNQQEDLNRRGSLSWQKRLFLLQFEVKQGLNWIDFLSRVELQNEKLLQTYKASVLEQFNSWSDLWKDLGGIKLTDPQQASFTNSQKAFIESMNQLESGHLAQAKQSLMQAEEGLDALIQSIWNDSPLILGEQLLLLYSNALRTIPLQSYSLNKLNAQQLSFQKQVELYAQKQPLSNDIQGALKESLEHLALSIKLLSDEKGIEAQIWAEDAARLLAQVVEALQLDHKTQNPTHVLEKTIQQQQLLTRWSQLWQRDKKQVPVPPALQELFLNVQTQALSLSDTFLPSVIVAETETFQQPPLKEGTKRCQKAPWDSVIPLFNKGSMHATEAKTLLVSQTSHSGLILTKQQTALDNWEDALRAMHSQNKKAPEQESKPLNKKEEEKQSVEEHVALLVEMEHNDRPTPTQKQTLKKPGLHPW